MKLFLEICVLHIWYMLDICKGNILRHSRIINFTKYPLNWRSWIISQAYSPTQYLLLHMSHVAALIDVAKLSKVASEKCQASSMLLRVTSQKGSRTVTVIPRSSDAAGQRVRQSLSPRKMTRAWPLSLLHTWLLGRHSRGFREGGDWCSVPHATWPNESPWVKTDSFLP